MRTAGRIPSACDIVWWAITLTMIRPGDIPVVSCEFAGGRQCTGEEFSCNRPDVVGTAFGTTFHGDSGTIKLTDCEYVVYHRHVKAIQKEADKRSDGSHIQNFGNTVRCDHPAMPNAEITEEHKRILRVHSGNIFQRTGDSLRGDPSNSHALANDVTS